MQDLSAERNNFLIGLKDYLMRPRNFYQGTRYRLLGDAYRPIEEESYDSMTTECYGLRIEKEMSFYGPNKYGIMGQIFFFARDEKEIETDFREGSGYIYDLSLYFEGIEHWVLCTIDEGKKGYDIMFVPNPFQAAPETASAL